MTLPINLNTPSSFANAFVIGDSVQVPGGSVDGLPTLPKVGVNPISAAIYLPTVNAGLTISAMTTAQRNALTPYHGMIVYNTDTNTYDAYFSGIAAWDNIGSGGATDFSTIYVNDGSAAAPSYSFKSDHTLGMYKAAANTLAFSVSGLETANITPATLTVIGDGVAAGQIELTDEGGVNSVALDAPLTLASSLIFTLPGTHPAVAGVPLVSDAAGNLSFPLGGVQFVSGNITAAQINALNTTSIEIIAPLANLGIIVHRFAIEIGTGTAPTGGGNIYLQWGNNPGSTLFNVTDNIAATFFTGGGASARLAIASGKEYLAGTAAGNASFNGVWLTNDGAAFVGATFNANVYVWYSYVTLSPTP